MELRAALQLPTLIKAMNEVVLPALDPSHKLAQEQAQLVLGVLRLMQQQLPLQYRYDRTELAGFLALAEQVRGPAATVHELGDAAATLQQATRSGREVLERARAEPSELEQANLALRSAVGTMVQAAAALPASATRDAIESAVFAHAGEQLLRERAWLAMQGWEGPSAALPPIESLLAKPA